MKMIGLFGIWMIVLITGCQTDNVPDDIKKDMELFEKYDAEVACELSQFCVTQREKREIEVSYGLNCNDNEDGVAIVYFEDGTQSLHRLYQTGIQYFQTINRTEYKCMTDEEICPPESCMTISIS